MFPPSYNAKFTETANQMVLSYFLIYNSLSKEMVDVKHTADFQGDACSSFITECTYSKESYAKQAYEDAMANKDEDDQISIPTKARSIKRMKPPTIKVSPRTKYADG